MFGIGFTELMIILVIALVVLGPEKLPGLAKAVGRAMGEFRKATDELKQTINANDDLAEIKKTFSEARDGMTELIREQAAGLDPEKLSGSLADGTFFGAAEEVKTETEGAQPAAPVDNALPPGDPQGEPGLVDRPDRMDPSSLYRDDVLVTGLAADGDGPDPAPTTAPENRPAEAVNVTGEPKNPPIAPAVDPGKPGETNGKS